VKVIEEACCTISFKVDTFLVIAHMVEANLVDITTTTTTIRGLLAVRILLIY
jgi:hypothetical protein